MKKMNRFPWKMSGMDKRKKCKERCGGFEVEGAVWGMILQAKPRAVNEKSRVLPGGGGGKEPMW